MQLEVFITSSSKKISTALKQKMRLSSIVSGGIIRTAIDDEDDMDQLKKIVYGIDRDATVETTPIESTFESFKKILVGESLRSVLDSIIKKPENVEELENDENFKEEFGANEFRDHFFNKKKGYSLKIFEYTITVVTPSVNGSPVMLKWKKGKVKGKGMVLDFLNVADPYGRLLGRS